MVAPVNLAAAAVFLGLVIAGSAWIGLLIDAADRPPRTPRDLTADQVAQIEALDQLEGAPPDPEAWLWR